MAQRYRWDAITLTVSTSLYPYLLKSLENQGLNCQHTPEGNRIFLSCQMNMATELADKLHQAVETSTRELPAPSRETVYIMARNGEMVAVTDMSREELLEVIASVLEPEGKQEL